MPKLTKLKKFRPPGLLKDLEGDQLDKWSQTVNGWFREEISGDILGRGKLVQFFNPTNFDHDQSLPPVPITWVGFPLSVRIKQPTDEARWAYAENPENQRVPEGRNVLPPLIQKYRWVMDEYLEWSTKKVDGDVQVVSFTCEGPEYWEEVARYNPILTETPIKNPAHQKYERNNKILDIYKKLNPDFADQIKGDDLVNEDGTYNKFNKWNGHTDTGTIAHIIQYNNSLSAEIDIAAVTRTDLVYGETITNMLTLCGDGSSYGNPGRNSDPTIGAAVNEVCRLARDKVLPIDASISVKDPVALYIYDADFSSFLLDRTGKRRGNTREMSPVPDGVLDWRGRGDITENMGLHLRVSIPKGMKTDDGSRDLNVSDIFDQNNGGRYVHCGSQFADYIFMSVSARTYTEPYLEKPVVEPKLLGPAQDVGVSKMSVNTFANGEINAVVMTADIEVLKRMVAAKEGPPDLMGMPEPGPPNGPDFQPSEVLSAVGYFRHQMGDEVLCQVYVPNYCPSHNPKGVGQTWIDEMQFWGQWDLSNYDHVKEQAVGIYKHLRSKAMPVTRNPDHYWPEDALEVFRNWVNSGFLKDAHAQPMKPEIVIPEPNDPSISYRVRKDIMSMSREELVIYQSKLDEILRVRELDSKWQELGVLHAYWCLHYQEATFLWYRVYLRYVEELIDHGIPYWNGYANEAACETSKFAGIPPMFLEETYVHPSGERRPNPLRFALALDGKSKKSPNTTVTRCSILTEGQGSSGWKETIGVFKKYHNQMAHALQQSTYTTPESAEHFGVPWANITKFGDDQRDNLYPFRFDFDGLFEQIRDKFHGWVCPDMADNTYTAFDPIFLSYHANMDRLAGIFMDANPENQFTSRFPLQPFISHGTDIDYDDPRRWRYTTTGDMAKDTRALGYMYGEPASPDFSSLKTAQERGVRRPIPSGGKAIVLPIGLPGQIMAAASNLVKAAEKRELTPYVVFTESMAPDAVGNPDFIGQVTRLGMGRGRDGSGPPNTNRCRKPTATRVLSAAKFKDRLTEGDVLKITVTDLETGKEVDEEEYKQMSGFVPKLAWLPDH
ncbi:Hemocyanin, beta-C chain unit D [Fusarium agapanthi]|uniref:tyrosinase n=1 Tax=Fusarium agapanthi TaxID=1803897 RepID=A0A9P5E3Y1_9HYPO|nr:Hemocyanin, beta-C chain unit D [Fusarium agapanthi]